jgi:predicted ribosomally synthesized peptide with SipW-like signal peptide
MAENDRQRRGRKLLLTLLIVGVVGSIAGIGTFSAFSATASNEGNSFAAGTVYIVDNDSDSAMFNVSDAKPGTTYTSCIKVTYLGSLDASVVLYGAGFGGDLAPYLHVTVEEGSGAAGFGDCTGFTSSSVLYNDVAMGSFPTTSGAGNATGGTWSTNEAVDYRFTITLADDNAANGGTSPKTADAFSFTWEAQNV